MSFSDLKENIIDEDLCTSCGMCVPACPKNLISLTDQDVPLPEFTGYPNSNLDLCQSCSICQDICPGFDTGAAESDQRIFGRERNIQERWIGIYQNSFQLTTKDEYIIGRVAAGGAGTILGITALEENYIDAMLVIGRDEKRPWKPKAILTNSIDEIIECSQSSYCLTPNLHLLNETSFERIGIIGVPCQVQAVNKVLNNRENENIRSLANKLVFCLEIACASSTSITGTEHLITDILGISLSDVAEMRYRQGDYPGQFYVRTHDGKDHFLPFYRLVEEFKKYKTYRCLSCPDWWSGLADISIADGDPNIFEASKNKDGIPPSSTVIVRTDLGSELIYHALSKNYIDMVDYDFENNLGLERKRQRYHSYRKNSSKKVPISSKEEEELHFILSDDEVIHRGVPRNL